MLVKPHLPVYLAVGIDDRSQQFPGTPSSVHAHHPQDLQEAKAAQCRRGKNVSLAASRHNSNGRNENNDVCSGKKERVRVWFTLSTDIKVFSYNV